MSSTLSLSLLRVASLLLCRFAGWRTEDVSLLNRTVDASLMELFQYKPAVPAGLEELVEGRR